MKPIIPEDMPIKNSWEAEKKVIRTQLKRKVKTALKYQIKCAKHLELCLQGENQKHLAELLQAFLYKIPPKAKQVILQDWIKEGEEVTIALDPQLKPHEEVAKRFKMARKWIKGLPHAQREAILAKENVLEMTKLLETCEAIVKEEDFLVFKDNLLLPPPQSKKKEGTAEPRKPYLELIAPDGTLIWVGRSARDNDELTFKCASGNDLWAHTTGVSGSHVVAKVRKGEKISDEALQMLLREAILHSKAKNAGEGEVSVTQVKFVKRYGKIKGKVQIANEKRYFIRLRP